MYIYIYVYIYICMYIHNIYIYIYLCVYIEMDLGFDGMFSLKTEFGFEGGERIMYVS